MIIEDIGIRLVRDPIALAINVYHALKWPDEDRWQGSRDDKISLIADNFYLTTLEVKKAYDYLDKCGLG